MMTHVDLEGAKNQQGEKGFASQTRAKTKLHHEKKEEEKTFHNRLFV